MARPLLRAAIMLCASFLTLPLLAQDPAGPTLSAAEVPAQGEQGVLLQVPRFGRYAVFTRSLQGASVQLVDRAAGPGQVSGAAGEADGRLDVFLEKGEYKLKIKGPDAGKGQVAVNARAFDELSGVPAPRLLPTTLVSGTLEDFQQRSWWVDLRVETDPLAVEVMGRSLADLRLWADGSWLVDVRPRCEQVEPVSGQPQRRCQLTADLPLGLYLLTAYGGPELPWAQGDEQPLHLLWGVPTLPPGLVDGVISPFGRDRFLVEDQANTYRMELPEVRPATLRVGNYNQSAPYQTPNQSAQVLENSRLPVAEIKGARTSQPALVEISGAPGQPYTLQRFQATGNRVDVKGDKGTLITTVHGGAAIDNIDATAVLVRVDVQPNERIATQAIRLDEKPWRRRFNLLEPVDMLIELKEPSKLRVSSRGTAASYKVEPLLLVAKPKGYEEPPWVDESAHTFDELPAGVFVLRLMPKVAGIADIELGLVGFTDSVKGALGLGEAAPESAPLASVLFSQVNLDPKGRYHLLISRQGGVSTGAQVRALPLDLRESLPLSLAPGQSVDLALRVEEAGLITLSGLRGQKLEAKLDNGAWGVPPAISAGDHRLSLRNPGSTTLSFDVSVAPPEAKGPKPLPPMTQEDLASIPDFPRLKIGSRVGVDLIARGEATFAVQVDEPGLYALRSTGRLAVRGSLRTRIITQLAVDQSSGPGENFLIQRWLDPGEYQLTVRSLTNAPGHLGVELQALPLKAGGLLREDVPGRLELAAGEGALWAVDVPETDLWRVQVYGASRSLFMRLDEADGWPLVQPGAAADQQLTLQAGRYTLIALPDDVDGRVQALLTREVPALGFEGHGPHTLPWDRSVEHTWREPVAGGTRQADEWDFTLPADATVHIAAGGEMHGQLLRREGQGYQEQAAIGPGLGFNGSLKAGDYRISLLNARRSDRAPYLISLRSEELLAGQSRVVSVPSTLSLSVGQGGVVELETLGRADVEALLLDADGQVLGSSDDRPNDWNALISAELSPGLYTLRLMPVGSRGGQTTVRFRAPPVIEGPTLRAGAPALIPELSALLLPLDVPADAELLALSARSDEAVGLALEAQVNGRWRRVASEVDSDPVLLVRGGGGVQAWRARLWSADGRGLPASARIDLIKPERSTEASLSRGASLSPARGEGPRVGTLRVKLSAPGLFGVVQGTEGLRWCPRPAEPCQVLPPGGLPVETDELWLAAQLRPDLARAGIILRRVNLEDKVRLELPGGAVARLRLEGQGLVVVTARADAGQPGLALGQAPNPGIRPELALSRRAALVVSASPSPELALWSAEGDSLPVTLIAQRFAQSPAQSLPNEGVELELAPGKSAAVGLSTPSALQLSLTEGLVLAQVFEGKVERVAWADGRSLAATWPGARGVVVVLNPGDSPGKARIDALPSSATALWLRAGQPLEQVSAQAGQAQVLVEPSQGTLRLMGGGKLTLLRADGSVARGDTLELRGLAGLAWVDHGPGRWILWSDDGDGALWGKAQASASPATLPGLVTLNGVTMALTLKPADAGALELRSDTPLIAGLRLGGQVVEATLLEAGGSARFTVPASGGELLLRGVSGQPLSGQASLVLRPVIPALEGLGPERLLSPGGAALYRFTVTQPGPVGLGLRGERASLSLYDVDGRRLSEPGGAAMLDLKPGVYLLRLDLDEDGGPARARPALVGIEPPPTTPPPEVVQAYREGRDPYAPAPVSEPEESPLNLWHRGGDEQEEAYEDDEYEQEGEE